MVTPGLLASLLDLAIVVAFALVAIGARAIDRRGFLASLAVGYPILLGGGLRWFVMVATFFVLGVAFTWYRYEYKKSIGSAQEKGGTRNWPNILANGGVASLLGLGELLGGGVTFAVLYLGAISAAASDTVATELGLLSRSPPRLITNLARTVSPGTSGGVSAMGMAGTLLASALIGGVAGALGVASVAGLGQVVAIGVAGGVAGSLADSLAGATFQRKSFCVVCGKPSENLEHCGEPTRFSSGLRLVDNHVVNVLATLVGALGSLGLYLLIR
ncbi:MAG: DUF92 domain-containing protein [Nitrososphaerota archaeon]|nr:DUF92 domain-containing protein [Nitrososphaerota archaeon]MDG6979451.1 DUF92 domain-containing protein [Nitrososphaerota archaeon]MDG7021298.1 DUF92 domain-containing protein [Nitrososphaerota archaeon]